MAGAGPVIDVILDWCAICIRPFESGDEMLFIGLCHFYDTGGDVAKVTVKEESKMKSVVHLKCFYHANALFRRDIEGVDWDRRVDEAEVYARHRAERAGLLDEEDEYMEELARA